MRQRGFTHETLTMDEGPLRLRALRLTVPPRVEPETPVICIHGLGCSGEVWEPTLRCLSALQRAGETPPRAVFVPDLPGCGHTPPTITPLGIYEFADWTVRLMDKLNLPCAHVVGHSMGCQVALAMARRHPTRVSGLVLLGPTVGDHAVPVWRYGVGLVRDAFNEKLSYNRLLLKMYFQAGPVRYTEMVVKMMDDDVMAHLGEIRAPSMVLRGDKDKIVPLNVVHRLAEGLPVGEEAVIADSAHAAQFVKPEKFTHLMLDFLLTVADKRRAADAQLAANVSANSKP